MKKTLLVFLAHPDDESFGPGGTLAKYAAEGVDVHIAIATDGAAGSVADDFNGNHDQLAAIRLEELKTAVSILNATLHHLDYRDSGYINDSANDHPDAFINIDPDETTRRLVALIRELRPQVLLTHDETGGYYHPDHIHCWKIGTAAFHAAADPARYPNTGQPHQCDRLYYTAFANTRVKWIIRLMRLRRMDPTAIGQNKDIDLTRIGIPPEQLHTHIDYRPYWDVKLAASACHASQGGGGGFTKWLPMWVQKRLFGHDTFIRAYPPTPDGFRETDFWQ